MLTFIFRSWYGRIIGPWVMIWVELSVLYKDPRVLLVREKVH